MDTKYIIYNLYEKDGKCEEKVYSLAEHYEKAVMIDMNKISNYKVFFSGLDETDDVIICGGDDTLNHFINSIRDLDIKTGLFFFAVGLSNDFVRDIGKENSDAPSFRINRYTKALPSVTFNDEERLFINGVGCGIDGYCCAQKKVIRNRNRSEGKGRKISDMRIAIRGVLRNYRPANASVTIDGKKYTYKKVWLASTMNGRYCNGMMLTPNQERQGKKKKLSLMVLHGTGWLKTLMIFFSIFKGKHIKYAKAVEILSGYDIRVEFDHPVPLHIDGETVSDVSEYTARSSICVETQKKSATRARKR